MKGDPEIFMRDPDPTTMPTDAVRVIYNITITPLLVIAIRHI